MDLSLYLHPTYFIESMHPDVVALAHELTAGLDAPSDRVERIFYHVRDTWRYDPYHVRFEPALLRAGYLLSRPGTPVGYCTEKAILYASLCRAVGIPNRLVFCNVRNHIATGRIEKVLRTDLMVFHGYNEVWLHGRWVKGTVAFNKSLCDKLGVAALDFDDREDRIFQQYDRSGGQFMVYERDYGSFHDLPFDLWLSETQRYYPHLFIEKGDALTPPAADAPLARSH